MDPVFGFSPLRIDDVVATGLVLRETIRRWVVLDAGHVADGRRGHASRISQHFATRRERDGEYEQAGYEIPVKHSRRTSKPRAEEGNISHPGKPASTMAQSSHCARVATLFGHL